MVKSPIHTSLRVCGCECVCELWPTRHVPDPVGHGRRGRRSALLGNKLGQNVIRFIVFLMGFLYYYNFILFGLSYCPFPPRP